MVALPPLPARSVSVEKQLRPTATVEDLDEQAKGGDGTGERFEQFEHYFLVNDTPAPPPATPAAAAKKAAAGGGAVGRGAEPGRGGQVAAS